MKFFGTPRGLLVFGVVLIVAGIMLATGRFISNEPRLQAAEVILITSGTLCLHISNKINPAS